MDWSDERYVRVYIRDTPTWKAIEWDGQCVFVLLIRKVDRAGVLDFGEGNSVEEAVKAVTDLPLSIVESGLPKLLRRKVAVVSGQLLVVPNFIEAQEASQSDKHRAREYRARRRDKARHVVTFSDDRVTESDHGSSGTLEGASAPTVTKSDGRVTKQVPNVTKQVQNVTPSLAVPNRSDRSLERSSKTERSFQAEASDAREPQASASLPSTNGHPAQPMRRTDLLAQAVAADGYEPLPEHEAYAAAIGLSRSEYQSTLTDLLRKMQHRRPATPQRWDSWLCSFLDTEASGKATKRRKSPHAPTAVPPARNGFTGPIARRLFNDDEDA